MRNHVIPLLSCLLFAGSAAASSGLPHFKAGTPYSNVRAQLVRHGFAPVAVADKAAPDSKFCHGPCAPELIQCAADAPLCQYLFVRQADGALIEVQTRYEGGKTRGSQATDETERFDTIARRPKAAYSDKTLTIPHRSAAK
jgi:hypothetical protein